MSIDTSKVATHATRHRGHGDEAQPGRRRRRAGPTTASASPRLAKKQAPQGLPRPLVLHARRDRAVELHRPAAHRRLPDPVVHARAWARSTYDGSYDQLRGIQMSEAYASTLNISFDVRGGLLMRQMHHWAAMLFVAAMMVHLLRVFFTGALPQAARAQLGDRLPAAAPRHARGLHRLLAARRPALRHRHPRRRRLHEGASPVVGTYMSFFLFGGEFPGDSIIPRLFTVHVLLIPGLLLALIGAHMLLLVYHKHTQWPGPGRTEQNVVGYPMLPGLRRQGRRVLLHRLRRHGPDGRRCCRSTRCGSSGPTTRPR